MSISTATTCCLNLPSPPSNSSKPNQIPWQGKVGLCSWKKKCLVGMTCMVIGSEVVMPLLGSEYWAIAENMQVNIEESKKGVARWSDARTCPPWQLNNLEIIVPENLPRPSSHRRSEWVKLSQTTPSNPTVRLPALYRSKGNCFSM